MHVCMWYWQMVAGPSRRVLGPSPLVPAGTREPGFASCPQRTQQDLCSLSEAARDLSQLALLQDGNSWAGGLRGNMGYRNLTLHLAQPPPPYCKAEQLAQSSTKEPARPGRVGAAPPEPGARGMPEHCRVGGPCGRRAVPPQPGLCHTGPGSGCRSAWAAAGQAQAHPGQLG